MRNKYQITVMLILIAACHSRVKYSSTSCDRIGFHDDNKRNDTTKVLFKDRVVFDTTANRISGVVIDSNTNMPIEGAKIYLHNRSMNFADTTDIDGNFSVFRDNFSGKWQMMIHDLNHKCLQLENIEINGGLTISVKLQVWLTKAN